MTTFLGSVRKIFHDRVARNFSNRLSPQHIHLMVRGCRLLLDKAPEKDWHIRHIHRSLSDMQVLVIGAQNSETTFVIYLPQSDLGVSSYARRANTLARLQADERLGHLQKLTPRVIHEGEFMGRPYWIAEKLPGIELTSVLEKSNHSKQALKSALNAIRTLHLRSARKVIINDAFVEDWVKKPVRIINESIVIFNSRQTRTRLERFGSQLAESLIGRHLSVSWIHGDYWPGNILVSEEGDQITGIVDWEAAHPDGLPFLDELNLLISAERIATGLELGRTLVQKLENDTWISDIGEISFGDKGHGLDKTQTLALFWLRHLSDNLIKSKRYAINPVWVFWNYRYVLNALVDRHGNFN